MEPIYSTSNGYIANINGERGDANLETLRKQTDSLAALELQRQENAALIQSYWIQSFLRKSHNKGKL